MTKAQQQARLIERVAALLADRGAVANGNGVGHGAWLMMTQGGVLSVALATDTPRAKEAPTITLFCQFKESAKAKQAGFLEQYTTSSKWNHHGVVDYEEAEAIISRALRGAPAPHEQALAMEHYRTKLALRNLMWKARDYLGMLESEPTLETPAYIEQLRGCINTAAELTKGA